MHARLGTTCEHRVGVAAADELRRLADRVRAGRARRDRGVVGAAIAERDRELAARGVDEHARDEGRRDAVVAAATEHLGLLHDPDQASDCGAEEDADAPGLVGAVEARVTDRLPRRTEREQDVALELAHLLR